MAEVQTELFTGVLTDIANGPQLGSHGELTAALMRRLAEKGATLEQLSDRKIMNRSIRTLQANARKYEIAFPDYIPFSLRTILEFEKTGQNYTISGKGAKLAAEALGYELTNGECVIKDWVAADKRTELEAAFFRVRGLPRG